MPTHVYRVTSLTRRITRDFHTRTRVNTNVGLEQSSHKVLYSKVSEGTPGKEQLTRPMIEMKDEVELNRDCCLEATARLGMRDGSDALKRHLSLMNEMGVLPQSDNYNWRVKRSAALKQQLQPKRDMKNKEKKTLVGTDALKATPVSKPINSCGSKDWNPFKKLEVPKIMRRDTWWEWREMRSEKSLWTWFGLDLILNG